MTAKTPAKPAPAKKRPAAERPEPPEAAETSSLKSLGEELKKKLQERLNQRRDVKRMRK
jgi:hypothetical protein